jgi:hypothetical protein
MRLQKLNNHPAAVRDFLAYMHSEQSVQRKAERRQNPVVPGMEDVIDQPVYDSFSLAANTAFPKTVLFQTPIGTSGKTLAQTFMTQNGILQNPQRLIVTAIGVVIANNTTPTDVVNIQNNVSFTFTVGKKPMLEVPVLALPAGRGMVLNSVATTVAATSLFSTSNGAQDYRGMYTLAHPIEIASGEGFSVTLNPETPFSTQAAGATPPGVGTTIYVFLDGYLYRGVQ